MAGNIDSIVANLEAIYTEDTPNSIRRLNKEILDLAVFVKELANPTSWVRPSGTTYGTGDGSSYDNAWSGASAIQWGSLQGDTLTISGVHTEKFTVGASNITIDFDQVNVTEIDGTGITEVFDVTGLSNVTINDPKVNNGTTTNLNINNSLNIVTNNAICNGSGNQGIQHLGTSTAVHNNPTCDNNADDGISAHNSGTVTVNGGSMNGNSEGMAFVNSCKFTVDGTTFSGNTLNDITCRSNEQNVFKNITADRVVVDSPDVKIGVTASFENCTITTLEVSNGQEIKTLNSVIDSATTAVNGANDVMTFDSSLIKSVNSKVGATLELIKSRLLVKSTFDLYGIFKATQSLIDNTGGVDHLLDFQNGSTVDINYSVLISALQNKDAAVLRTGTTLTSFKGNTIDGKGIGRGLFTQITDTITNCIIANVTRTDNAAGLTYENCDIFNAGAINGLQTNCIYTDPLWVAPLTLDYTLGVGSGAIDSGLTVTPVKGIDTVNWGDGATTTPSVTVKDNTSPFDIGAYII